MKKEMEDRLRIKSLQEARKGILDEFGDWPMYYTKEWFIKQMIEIDTRLHELTGIHYLWSHYTPKPLTND